MSGASEIASAQGEVKETKSNRLGGLVRMNFDWITRPVFGLALAGLAILATIRGGLVFVILISLGCSAAIREWHRLFARRDFVLPAVITVLAMLGALLWRLETPPLSAMLSSYGPFVVLLIGTLCNVLLSASRHEARFASERIFLEKSIFEMVGQVVNQGKNTVFVLIDLSLTPRF